MPAIAVTAMTFLVIACSSGEPESSRDAQRRVTEVEIARAELVPADKDWRLDSVGSVYDVDGDDIDVRSRSYGFASAGPGPSRYTVWIDSDGTVGSVPTAGLARTTDREYDPTANDVGESEAIELAWDGYGAAVVELCGELRHLHVSGRIGGSGQPWRIEHHVGGSLLAVFVDPETGRLFDSDEPECS